MTSELAHLRWPDVGGQILAVPLGATEQHGRHLPLDTDTAVATELCLRLAREVPEIVVAPALPYGSSGEHAGFPGTLSIGQAALEHVLVELVRSADDFDGVVLVNGHGGNLVPLRAAVRLLRSEGRTVLAWAPSGRPDDSHAGHAETSVMLRLRPDDVRLDAAAPGDVTPLPELMTVLARDGVRAVSPDGVLGDPSGASAADGDALLRTWADRLVATVREWLAR